MLEASLQNIFFYGHVWLRKGPNTCGSVRREKQFNKIFQTPNIINLLSSSYQSMTINPLQKWNSIRFENIPHHILYSCIPQFLGISIDEVMSDPQEPFHWNGLTYEFDLDIHPLDFDAKIQVSMSVCSAGRVRRTEWQDDEIKTITPIADVGCNEGHYC